MNPKPEVGTVKYVTKNARARGRNHGPPATKPSTKNIANLNAASLGELIRNFEKVCREQGHGSSEAAKLRFALNKALEVEGFGLTPMQENRLNMTAVRQRYGVSAGSRRRAVNLAVSLVEKDTKLAIRGAMALIAMDRVNG